MIYTAGKPIYIQIKNNIISDIKKGKYPENTALPAVNVLADNAGVSVRTAYLAIQELIKDGICYKRPKKGTYVGSPANYAKHPVCAVWTKHNVESPFEHPLSSIFYCGLLQGCADNNITPVLVGDDPEMVIKRYERSKEFDFKGVIILDWEKFDDAVDLAKKFPEKKFFFINYVMKNMNSLPSNMIAIVNNNYTGAYKMAEHLIAGGCKDAVFLSTQLHISDRTYHNRIKGALTAFNDYSIKIKKEEIIKITCKGQNKQAFLAITKLLRSGRRPQAIFCANDLLAAGAAQALAVENISGVQVCGYDHIYPDLRKQWGFPTMKVPYSKMVMEALRLLNSDEEINERIIKLQPEMIK